MFTFRAFASIVFFSAIAVLLLKAVFRNNTAVLRMDIRFLLACMLLVLLRMFIPVESPVTSSIPVYEIYPAVYMWLKRPLFSAAGIEVNILLLAAAVWVLEAARRLARLIRSYMETRYLVDKFPDLGDERASVLVERIGRECGRKTRFRLAREDNVSTPFVFGLLRPCIVVPECGLTERELYFVLKHEMMHYYRGDMLMKLFCEVLRAVYWWNWFAYKLCDMIEEMQEINVDFSVIRNLPELEQLEYPECLVKVARNRVKNRQENRWKVAFKKESPSAVHKRISLMLENMEINGKKTLTSIFLSVIVLGLIVLCPNVLIFEPYAISESDAEGNFGVEEGVFFLRNPDGKFDFYYNGEYVATVLEVSGENAKIYDNLEEALGK
ncbi:MAG TPA: hypothetical protein DCZ40_01090 [Lachnospiraceae bacterium]|nr:hypothetical protein [Lachnospiraceae bacterium]